MREPIAIQQSTSPSSASNGSSLADSPTSSFSSHSSESPVAPKITRPMIRRQSLIDDSANDSSSTVWTQHSKHLFVLSSAGKPVWTRYGDESRISPLMGVIQAIISFFQDSGDMIKSIKAGEHKFVFLHKEPLYFLAVSQTGESDALLREQLLYIHNQILSVLTSVQLTKIFQQRVNFDLRRLLGGTEVFLDSLSGLFCKDHSFMLSALQCLRLNRSVRDQAGSILSNGRVKNLLYAMIVAKGRLVTLLRPRKNSLHPSDLHLLFNMLTGSTTFRAAESWTPLCLPKFNSKGFLHAYICYVEKDVSIVMISTDKDRFFEISEWKTSIVETMQKRKVLEPIVAASEKIYTIENIRAPSLLHFLYKSKIHVQFTCPAYTEPYTNEQNQRRLFHLYQHMHDRMHARTRPLKLYYHESEQEIGLGWITSSFELYFESATTMDQKE
ncbi:hypothetical protein VTP01DRAFT_7359 [Rhizomucor pusillus]|uniref:uncharacterized protein n=1 Tax=Rhizomucor pusillus TaxID=4840 RepID=UPI0037420E01